MKSPHRLCLLTSALVLTGAPAYAGEVHVRSLRPDTFTDSQLKANFVVPDPVVLQAVTNHLQGLAGQCLKGKQTLTVLIHDIDLAGQLKNAFIGRSLTQSKRAKSVLGRYV